METLKKRLGNLLTVKSIVTIVLTVVFTVLALRGSISGTEFLTMNTQPKIPANEQTDQFSPENAGEN